MSIDDLNITITDPKEIAAKAKEKHIEEIYSEDLDSVMTKVDGLKAKIVAIGVGGGGGNMINYIIENHTTPIITVAANTDTDALSLSKAEIKIKLGPNKTRGQGAGGKPDVGRDAAYESLEAIEKVLKGADVVFIGAGMGGGTGTGAAPVIANAAKKSGALTISFITMPFKHEGKIRARDAQVGAEEMKRETDSLVMISNDKLIHLLDPGVSSDEAYSKVDEILTNGLMGVADAVLGKGRVNVDLADLRTIMSYKGHALLSIGYGSGENAAQEAFEAALDSPLLENKNISDAKGALIVTEHHSKYSFIGTSNVYGELNDLIGDETNIIQGDFNNDNMEPDEYRVILIVTGFDEENKKVIKPNQTPTLNAAPTAPGTQLTMDETTQVPVANTPQQEYQKVVNEQSYLDVYENEIDMPSYLKRQQD